MKQAIVTGASKGLGKSFAHQLASRGFDLLLVARSENMLQAEADAIQKKYQTKVAVLSLDLSDNAAVGTILKWCQQNNFKPSVLINNAGYACWGFFDKIKADEHERMTQVNLGTL